MANEIDLSEPMDISPKIDLNQSTSITADPELAKTQSAKWDYALGKESPGFDVLYNSMLAGNEKSLRESEARRQTIETDKLRGELVNQFIRNQGNLPLNDSEYKFISGLTLPQLKNPDTVFEDLYAQKVVSDMYHTGSQAREAAVKESPKAVNIFEEIATQTISKREIAFKLYKDIEKEWENTPWLTVTEPRARVNEFIDTLIPFLSAYRQTNLVGPPFQTSWFTGNNKEEQYAYLMGLPTDRFQEVLQNGIAELRSKSLLDAQYFLGGLLGYGSSDKFLDSSMNVADVLSVVSPVAKGLLRTGVALKDYASALKSTVSHLSPKTPDPAEVAAASGKVDLAASVHYLRNQKEVFYSKDVQHSFSDLLSHIPSFMSPEKFFGGGFRLAREFADRILDKDTVRAGQLVEALNRKQGLDRLAIGAQMKAFERARQDVISEADNAGLHNAIIDIRSTLPEETVTNTGFTTIQLGRTDARIFENRAQAEFWKKEYGIPGLEVKPSGDGFVLELTRPVKETDLFLPIDTDNITPKNTVDTFLNSLGGLEKFRTPNEQLSKAQRGLRSVYIQGVQEFQRMVQPLASDISTLSKASKKKFRSFAESMRDYEAIGPSGEKIRGRFFNNMGDFEEAWTEQFRASPTAKETQAYLSYVRLNDFDYILRNIGLYSFKARKGVRQFRFAKNLPYFEGAEVKNIPWDIKEPGNILYVTKSGEKKVYLKQKASKEVRDQLDDAVNNLGYKVIQTTNPFKIEQYGTKAPINFVVTEASESKNLSVLQIPYKAGGHVVYDYQHYVKQPRIDVGEPGRPYYTGDVTLFPTTTETEARTLVRNLNEAQRIYNSGDGVAYKEFVDTHLPMNSDQLAQHFASGQLSKTEPFVYANKGSSAFDSAEVQGKYGRNLSSWRDSSYNLLKGMDTEFAGTRNMDIWAVSEELGSESNPLFSIAKSRKLDPMITMGRAVGRMIRQAGGLQDYTIRTAEQFVEEFNTVLENGARDLDRLRQNPMSVLMNPRWNEKADRGLLVAAKSYQRAAMNLIGVRSGFQKSWSHVQEKLLNSIYKTAGQDASEFVYEKMLPTIQDPVRFARQVAFHSKLGLLNPLQLYRQAHTAVATWAIAGPKNGTSGLAAGTLFQALKASNESEAMLSHYAGIAKAFGWKPDEFREAYQFMKDSGVWNIGTGHSWRTDSLDTTVFESTAGKWLDKGTFFFKNGERFNRMTGIATAYKEWRAANPLAKFDRRAQESIMSRYDDLTINMTHASDSSLNRGIGAIAGQFFSYQERMMELMLGKRLTTPEKLRLFGTFSAMYGVPVALAGATAYPFYDDMRRYMLENNIEETVPVEVLHEGVVEFALRLATGQHYDFNKFGPGGIQLLRDVWHGNADLAEIILGASGKITGDILKSTLPFAMDLASIFDEKSTTYRVAGQDFIDVLSNITTISLGQKMYYAMNAHSYMAKNENLVSNDISPTDGLMMGILGLTPREINDTFLMQEAIREAPQAQAFAREQAIKYFRRGFKADNDQDAAAFYRQAKVWLKAGGFRFDQLGSIYSDATKGYEPRTDQVNRSFQKIFPKEGSP